MAPEKPKKSKTPKEWENIYGEKFATYQAFTSKLRNLITELLRNSHIEVAQVESRTKSVDSFIGKIQREEKDFPNPLEGITDLVGIRIIAYHKEDVDEIGKIIEKEFGIDREKSMDKAQALDPDRFGYLSVHYVISLSSPRTDLPEWATFSNIKAEIQVRTVLQHAWATINHRLVYKAAKEIPKNLRRQLFRLSALLELADEEFSNLRKRTEEVEVHYSQEVEKGRLSIEVDLFSLEAYFESTKQHLKWMKIAEQAGFGPIKLEKRSKVSLQNEKSRLLRILDLSGITIIGELDKILQDASKWGKDALANICEISSDEGFSPFAVPHDVITLLVLYAKRKVLTKEIIEATRFENEKLKTAIEKVAKVNEKF